MKFSLLFFNRSLKRSASRTPSSSPKRRENLDTSQFQNLDLSQCSNYSGTATDTSFSSSCFSPVVYPDTHRYMHSSSSVSLIGVSCYKVSLFTVVFKIFL